MTEPSGQLQIDTTPAEDVNNRYAYALEERRMRLDTGWLGGFFGSASRAPTSIAGIIALLLTLSCIVSLFVPTNISSPELWKLVLPVITGILGYLFGKST